MMRGSNSISREVENSDFPANGKVTILPCSIKNERGYPKDRIGHTGRVMCVLEEMFYPPITIIRVVFEDGVSFDFHPKELKLSMF